MEHTIDITLIIFVFCSCIILFCVFVIYKLANKNRDILDGSHLINCGNFANEVPKYASPLAFDDKVLLCNSIDDIGNVTKKIESCLSIISHVWQPQDVIQLVLLCKNYINDGQPLSSTHRYYFLRYLESLVMEINWYNGYCFEKNKGLTEIEIEERRLVFDEINHLYTLAKSVKGFREENDKEEVEASQRLPGEDLHFDAEHANNDDSHSLQGNKKASHSPVIKVDAVPKVKSATVDADERLLHDLQNPHEELFDAMNLAGAASQGDGDKKENNQ